MEVVALHWAVTSRQRKIMKLLLKEQANPNPLDNNSGTPLHMAAGRGKETVVQGLLQYNANPKLRTDIEGFTPLHIACLNKRVLILKLLLEKVCDVVGLEICILIE